MVTMMAIIISLQAGGVGSPWRSDLEDEQGSVYWGYDTICKVQVLVLVFFRTETCSSS
jgi:hypothetical protein